MRLLGVSGDILSWLLLIVFYVIQAFGLGKSEILDVGVCFYLC